MTQLADNIWAVEVPDDANNLWLSDETQDHDASQHWVLFSLKGSSQPLKSLPPGTWQFLFTTKEATEEQAAKVVDRRKDLKDHPYKGYETAKLTACWNAKQSLESLLRSKGLDVNKNYAIILKQDNG